MYTKYVIIKITYKLQKPSEFEQINYKRKNCGQACFVNNHIIM